MVDQSKINDGGPAFPAWELNKQGQAEMTCFGMSLRQHYAATALPEVLRDRGRLETYEILAARAFEIADAMIKAGAA